jgi:hypothetical protein
MQAIIEVCDRHARGVSPRVVADLVCHARELLDIIETELAEHLIEMPGAASAVPSAGSSISRARPATRSSSATRIAAWTGE